MSEVDDRLELLITRRLDGEISEADEHELNKLVIRSPEARALLESYERQDAAVGSVLREALATPPRQQGAESGVDSVAGSSQASAVFGRTVSYSARRWARLLSPLRGLGLSRARNPGLTPRATDRRPYGAQNKRNSLTESGTSGFRWPWPAAAAAVVLLIGGAIYFGPLVLRHSGPAREIPVTAERAGGEPRERIVMASESADDGPEPVRYPRRSVNRDVFGVVGEDGKTMYLLNMDRTRTAVVPVSGDF